MKDFFDQLDQLSGALNDPEYLFLALEPLQFYGIGFAVAVLITAWFLKSEKLQVTALVMIIAAALSTLPYMNARKSAQNRLEHVYQVESPARVRVFAANTVLREEHQKFFFLLASLAGAAILVGPRRNRLGFSLTIASAVVGLYATHLSLWMHYQDSLAFHPNLKKNEAPVREKMLNRSGDGQRDTPAAGPIEPPTPPDNGRQAPTQPPKSAKPGNRSVRPLP